MDAPIVIASLGLVEILIFAVPAVILLVVWLRDRKRRGDWQQRGPGPG